MHLSPVIRKGQRKMRSNDMRFCPYQRHSKDVLDSSVDRHHTPASELTSQEETDQRETLSPTDAEETTEYIIVNELSLCPQMTVDTKKCHSKEAMFPFF